MLSLASINHVSRVCKSVSKSVSFYRDVLGFSQIKRPGSFDFDGAWLFNFGIGIHLIEAEDPNSILKKTKINPKDDHISFQCEDMVAVERQLEEKGIQHIHRRVQDEENIVDQLFFHDPDGYMIEICNCNNIPVIPLIFN